MIPAIEQSAVDGVPVLRAATPDGRTTAALVFRVGHYDETLPVRGITHMVEHLTFAGRPEAKYHFNASVSGRYTSFHAESSDPGDIRDFIETVCQGLAADHSAALDRERTILRTEAASRGSAGALGTCLAERYGAAGPGLVSYQEFGLDRATWSDVEAWRRRWFTRDNAVLWIAGDIPDGLRVDLPEGPPPEAADPRPLPLTIPAYVTGARGGVALSLVNPRDAKFQVALDVLQRRLTQVLRHEHGTTYGVQLDSEEVGPDLVHSWVAADALPEQVPMAAHGLLTTFESLRDDGCDPEEIRDFARRVTEAYESPGAPGMLLRSQARSLLNGRPVREPEEFLRVLDKMTPEDVSDAVRVLHDQMLVAVPGRVPAVDGRMDEVPAWSSSAVTGTRHQSRDSDAVLTVGDDGVTLTVGPSGNPDGDVTVRYDALAALLRWNDGRLALIGDDCFTIGLDPDEWPGDRAVPDEIAAHVPADKVITLDGKGSPRPGRGRREKTPDPAPPAKTAARSRTWGERLNQPIVRMRLIYLLLIIVGAVGLAYGLAPGGLLIAANVIYWIRQETRYGFLRKRR